MDRVLGDIGWLMQKVVAVGVLMLGHIDLPRVKMVVGSLPNDGNSVYQNKILLFV